MAKCFSYLQMFSHCVSAITHIPSLAWKTVRYPALRIFIRSCVGAWHTAKCKLHAITHYALRITHLMTSTAVLSATVEVSFMGGYDPDRPESAITRQIVALNKEHTELRPVKWGGLWLPGAGGRSPLLLAMAGGNAPDIYTCWFHIIQNDIAQGFLMPLDKWIGANGDTWEGWHRIPELWHRVASDGKHIYGLPSDGVAYYGIVYRKDLVQAAGLDPDAPPPATWEAFWKWCQKLTPSTDSSTTGRGMRAFGVCEAPWNWLPWMQSAGGSPVIQLRTSRLRGTPIPFPMEATECITSDGENLTDDPPTWRANFDSAEAIAAARFLQRLTWAPWIRHPQTGVPIDLSPEAVAAGQIEINGEIIPFSQADVIEGVVRKLPLNNDPEAFLQGEVAAMFAGLDALERITGEGGLDPELIGIMPFPSSDGIHPRVFQAHRHFWGISEGVAERPQAEQDLVFACLEALVSPELRDAHIKEQVLEGNARWCHPDDLKRLGLDAYLEEIPLGIRQHYIDLAEGKIVAKTEPFVGFWQGVSDLIQRRLLGLLLSEAGRTLDVEEALIAINADANRGLMFKVDEATLEAYRPTARWIFTLLLLALFAFFALKAKKKSEKAERGVMDREATPQEETTDFTDYDQIKGARNALNKGVPRTPYNQKCNLRDQLSNICGFVKQSVVRRKRGAHWHIACIMLAPALISIALWSYWPLIRGVSMAFYDYKIIGESVWVGLDNFILVATDMGFWMSVGRTLKYVIITLLLGFLSPIVLAILLSEIPRGKILYRTLYFLPHLTSTLVITLLWQLMYDPTAEGMLNQLFAFVGLPTQTWLQDPAWAMVCCILPGVWAGAGMASLIYIAALQALPSDYFEAAAIDGAGFRSRLRHILIPQLMPLMVINFVGAFIAAFQSIGSIFLLTFGGPGDATNVLSLAIWKEAYNNLRMGSATTMAWFLGVGLIGFTYLQFRILRKVEFRRAETN